MKFLLVFLFSATAFAQHAWFPVGKGGAQQNYWDQKECESKESHVCVETAFCPLDECKLEGSEMIVDVPKKAAKDEAIAAEVAKVEAKEDAKAEVKETNIDGLKSLDEVKAILKKLIESI